MEHIFCSKRCSSRSLAETIANTEELLTEILVRVPTRPLLRMKCVSKHWLSLISQPRFCHLHTLQNPNPPISAVLCDAYHQPFHLFPLDLDHIRGISNSTSNHEYQNPSRSVSLEQAENQYHGRQIRVVQSCNGLFLCLVSRAHHYIGPPFFIFNPTTNLLSTIFPPPATVVITATGEQVKPYIISIALAFDPSKSPHYKLVCLRTNDGSEYGEFCHIVMYSSETQSWRLLDLTVENIKTVIYTRPVYWNGAINWAGICDEVAYFHIEDESCKLFDNPDWRYSEDKDISMKQYRYFQESSDGCHLHLFDIYRPCFAKFEVFEMGRDYSGWFIKCRVDLIPLCTDFPGLKVGYFRVLFIDRDENQEEESSSLLLHYFDKFISYNLKTKIFKSFESTFKASEPPSLYQPASYYPYVETLACV